jgi:hypothetical protein
VPTSVAAGQVIEFNAAGPFVVTSQGLNNPFYLAEYMTGGTLSPAGKSAMIGDPDYVNIIAGDQYLNSYTFFVDPTYPDESLVFTRARDSANNWGDINIDCVPAGAVNIGGGHSVLSGASWWTDIGSNGLYQYARLQLANTPGQNTTSYLPNGTCQAGVHTATSTAPFEVTVWGWGYGDRGTTNKPCISGGFHPACPVNGHTMFVSSGYAGGAAIRTSNTTVVVNSPPAFGNTAYFQIPFQSACGPLESPTWHNFWFQALVPTGTTLKFSAQTSATQSGLATAPVVPLGTQTTDTSGWVGIDVNLALMGAGLTSATYLLISVEFDTSMTAAPTLIAWKQDQDCVANQ